MSACFTSVLSWPGQKKPLLTPDVSEMTFRNSDRGNMQSLMSCFPVTVQGNPEGTAIDNGTTTNERENENIEQMYAYKI